MKAFPALLVICLGVNAGAARGQDLPAAVQRLQGTWQVETFEVMGNKIPDPPLKLVVITADRYAYQSGRAEDKPLEFRYRLDSSKSPGEIDLLPPDEKSAGASLKGIYSLEVDELKLCFPLIERGKKPSDLRPEGFATEGKQFMLIVAKRKR